MDSSMKYKCWEIMNCDNLDCLARQEPETPCWEIAKRVEDYRSVSNTCRDCIVYLFKESVSFSNRHNIKDFISRRGLVENAALGNQRCVLKTNAAG